MSKVVVAKDLGYVDIAKLKQFAATNQNTIDTAVHQLTRCLLCKGQSMGI